MFNNQPLTWLIAIPLISAPLIYLVGRVPIHFRKATDCKFSRWLALAVLILAWIPLILTWQSFNQTGPILIKSNAIDLKFDGLSLLVSIVILSLGTLAVLSSHELMRDDVGEEKYYAMLVAMVGVMIGLGIAADMFNLWMWFEAMAVSSYLLVVFYRKEPASLEAGVKYVVQSATGSVLVLLGISLVLMQIGSVNMAVVAKEAGKTPLLLLAGGFFIIGFGVKAALVPLHTWLPDAHSQAPSSISAMLSGVVIEMGLIAMLRCIGPLAGTNGAGYSPAIWGGVLVVVGMFNLIIGNFMSLRQKLIKRMLAFSSLSHMGYILFGIGSALIAAQLVGFQGSLFHLLNHGLMKGLAFFGVGAFMFALAGTPQVGDSEQRSRHAPLYISDLAGAAQKYPLVALSLSITLLALGGLPPFAGFMSKWQIFVAGMKTGQWQIGLLVVFAALNSVLSLAYYAPIVSVMYKQKPSDAVSQGGPVPSRIVIPLLLIACGIIVLGFWPSLVDGVTGPAAQALFSSFYR